VAVPGAHAHVPVDPAAEGRRARAREHVAADLGVGADHQIPAPREQVVRDVPAHGDVAARDADRSAHVPRDDDLPGRGQHVSRHGSSDRDRLSRDHQVAVHGALDVHDLAHGVEVVVQRFRGGQHEVIGVAEGCGSGGSGGEGEEQEEESECQPGTSRDRTHGRPPYLGTVGSDPRKIVRFGSGVQPKSRGLRRRSGGSKLAGPGYKDRHGTGDLVTRRLVGILVLGLTLSAQAAPLVAGTLSCGLPQPCCDMIPKPSADASVSAGSCCHFEATEPATRASGVVPAPTRVEMPAVSPATLPGVPPTLRPVAAITLPLVPADRSSLTPVSLRTTLRL